MQALLDQVAQGQDANQESLPYAARLTRLYAAARELREAGERAAYGADLAPLWDRTLGLWSSVASWFGLHGHLFMSPVAALNMQTDIRQRAPASSSQSEGVRSPLGARASAIYSLALRAGKRHRRHLLETVELTTRAMEANPDQ